MSTITIATIDLVNFQYSASTVYLRLYAESSFVTSAGIPIQAGSPDGGSWYKQVTCTLVGTTLTLPQMTLDSTTDGLDITTGRYNAWFYDGNGRQLGLYAGFESFRVGLVTPTTWSALRAFNFTKVSTPDHSAFTKEESDARYATLSSALPTLGTANQILGVNSGATATEYKSLASGTSGSDFAIAHSANTVTFNLPTASATVRGALASADWTTFNNKVASTRAINTTAPLTGGGDLSSDRTIAIPVATSSVNGYLSSTDWATFNSKQTGDATLTALAAYNTNGFLAQTAADTFAGRTLTGTANQISIANGDGSGEPTFSIPNSFTLPSASPVFTQVSARLYDNKGLVINVKHPTYGALGDDANDDTAEIQSALDATLATGGEVRLPPGIYRISSGLTYGDGTSLVSSTRQGLTLRGTGDGATAAELISSGGSRGATVLKWIGAAGGTMLTLTGAMSGITIEDIFFECQGGANAAATALSMTHVMNSTFRNLTCQNHTGFAYVLTAYSTAVGGQFVDGASDNVWERVSAFNAGTNGSGIQLGAASVSGGTLDVSRNSFVNCAFNYNGTGTGVELRFVDSCTFLNTLIYKLSITKTTDSVNYPSGISFYNSPIFAYGTIDAAWNPTAKVNCYPLPVGDSEPIPTDDGFCGVTDTNQFFGAYTFRDVTTLTVAPVLTSLSGILQGNGASAVTAIATTGSGSVVLATSPTLVTPLLGTPTSGVLTNCTGLPLATGVTGTLPVANGGTGTTTSTGTGSVVLSTSPTLVTPLLGTPTSGTLTNCTGLPVSTGISGLGTGVATFMATPSSANLLAAVTDETGTGALVFATSPTLVTPVLGVATHSSLTGANLYGGAATGSTLSLTGTSNGSPALADILLNPTYTTNANGAVRVGTTSGGSYKFVVATDSVNVMRVVNTEASSASAGAGIIAANVATPSALGHRLAFYTFGASNGIAGTQRNAAAMAGFAAQAWTDGSAQGSYLTLETTPVGSATRNAREFVGLDKVLTDAATSLFEIALPAGAMAGGEIHWTIIASDGTDHQAFSGITTYAVVNKAGVYTKSIVNPDESDAATALKGAKAVSAGTLTATMTGLDGTDKITIQVTPTGSLTETTYKIYYRIINNSAQVITLL